MRWLKYQYLILLRRWKRRERIADIKRGAKAAIGMALKAERGRELAELAAASSLTQLAISRGLLASVMNDRDQAIVERDRALGEFEKVAAELADIKTKRENERAATRLFITRAHQVKVNLN